MSLFFSAVPPSGRIIPRGHNPLEYRYTFWLSKRKSVLKGKNYDQSMMKLGSFETVQQFWQYYSFMKRPSKVDEACDLMLVSRSSFWSLEKSVKNHFSVIDAVFSSNRESGLYGRTNQTGKGVAGRSVSSDTAQTDTGKMQLWPWSGNNSWLAMKYVACNFHYATLMIR